MDANAWAYFSGGAADEITLAANGRAWQQLTLLPRVLRRDAFSEKWNASGTCLHQAATISVLGRR